MSIVTRAPAPAAADWDVRTVRAGGTDIRLGTRGEGPPLLLVNGAGANLEMWRPFETLVTGRRLIAFDAPGTGDSPRPWVPLGMPGLAHLVEDLLDLLGQRQVDVLGYSFGGVLAQQLAHQAPERVRRLILAATTCGLGGAAADPLTMWRMTSPFRYYSRQYLEQISPSLFGGRSRRQPEMVRRHLDARLDRPPSVLGYQWQLLAVLGWSSYAWLPELTQPTLVLQGDDDPIIPVGNADVFARRLPNATVHVVCGGGHLFLLDQAEVVAPLVLRFLDA